jgi:hypothetical protein
MEYPHQSASLGLAYHNLAMLEEHEAVNNFPIINTYLANAIPLSTTMVSHWRLEHQIPALYTPANLRLPA